MTKRPPSPPSPPALPIDGQATAVPAQAQDFVKRAAAKIPDKPLPARKQSKEPKTLDAVTAAAVPVPPTAKGKAKPSRAKSAAPEPSTPPSTIPAIKPSPAERRHRFIEAYIANGHNATQAAITAGFSPKTAYSQGHRLLKHADTKNLIAARAAQMAARYELTSENVTRELARIAFFDPRKLVDAEGAAKPMDQLDDDTAAAIGGVDITEEFEGRGEDRVHVGYTKKFKIWDKNAALEKAMKHLGLFEKDNEQQRENLALQVVLVAAPGVPR